MGKRAAEGAADSAASDASGRGGVTPPPSVLGSLEKSPTDESLHGSWASDKGKCAIGRDIIVGRLYYEESLEDGGRLHGFLNEVRGEKLLWEGTLAILEAGKSPWYGTSFGPPPPTVGKIQVRLLSDEDATMETRIQVEDEDEGWQEPVKFKRKGDSVTTVSAPIVWTDPAVAGAAAVGAEKAEADEEEEEKEQGDRKRT